MTQPPKYLYVEVGATQNRNTGPPRTTLGKSGKPIVTAAAVLSKYHLVFNPAREGKYGNASFCSGEQECARRRGQRLGLGPVAIYDPNVR